MGSDDDTDERHVPEEADGGELPDETDATGLREPAGDREEVAAGPVDEVDARIVDLLSWILDTETRAKIYVFLLANPGSTSEEIATGTGLYPSTVREALAELHGEDRVSREKRASEGAGNNPYEYTAIQPSELVGGVVDQVQHELNTIFTLDRVLDRGDDDLADEEVEPVTITVEDETDADGPTGTIPGLDSEGDTATESATGSDAETGTDQTTDPEAGTERPSDDAVDGGDGADGSDRRDGADAGDRVDDGI